MKRVLSCICIIAFCLCFVLICRIFSFKYNDGILQIKSFYELDEGSLDVLVLGSSHAYVNILPQVIWDEANIASYDLCGSIAPMWNSYSYLREALKTQKPDLVVLEAFSLTQYYAYMDDSRIIKNTYGLKPSRVKYSSINISAPQERFWEFAIEPFQWHNRYTDLEKSDFRRYCNDEPQYKCFLGNVFSPTTESFSKPEEIADDVYEEIPWKQEDYYRLILELCKNNEIEVVVVVTPYPAYNEHHANIFNSARQIANEYGVRFVNFQNYTNEIGIDWKSDYADKDHMNYKGGEKFSRYLANFLCENYTVKKHDKSEAMYKRWNEGYEYFERRVYDCRLQEVDDIDLYFDMIEQLDNDYVVILFSCAKQDVNVDGRMFLQKLYISNANLQDNNEGHIYIREDGKFEEYGNNKFGYVWNCRSMGKELLVDETGVFWDRIRCLEYGEGMVMVIFDKTTLQLADVVRFSDGKIVR